MEHYTGLLEACDAASDWKRAVQLHSELKAAGLGPSVESYQSLIG
jgi:hypothetical protein